MHNSQTYRSKFGLLFLSLLIALASEPVGCSEEVDGEFCYRKEDCENDLHLFATNVSCFHAFTSFTIKTSS